MNEIVENYQESANEFGEMDDEISSEGILLLFNS